MKFLTRFLVLCCAFAFSQTALDAQCNFTGVAYTVSNAPTTCTPLTNTAFYFNEYATFNNLTIGATYTFTATVTSGGVAPYSFNVYTSTTVGGAPVTFVNSATSPLTISSFVATTTTVYLKNFSSATGACSTPGSGGGLNSFTIQCTSCASPTVPTCPTLSAPAANAINVSLTPTLSWAASTGAVSYDVYLNADATCSITPTTLVATVTTTSYTVTTPLSQLTQYRWTVIPRNCGGVAPASCTPRCFTTSGPPPSNDNCATATAFPTIATDGTCSTLSNQTTAAATNSAVTPTGACASNLGTPDDDVWFSFVAPATSVILQYTYVSGLTDIYWQVFSSACGASMVSTACSDADAGATLTGLVVGNTYYIRLYTYATTGNTTQNICLKTLPAAPNCATLVSPANGATGVALNTPLTWTAPVGGGAPTAYKVYFGTVNPPLTLVSTVAAPATSYTPTTTYNTTYYWYVVPTNAGGDAVGCNTTIFSFTTGAPPPAPANDLCSGATSITSAPGVFSSPGIQTTESATQTATPGTGGTCTTVSVTDYDVWYSFTTDADGGDITISVTPTTATDIIVQGFTVAGSCSGASVCADAQVTGGPLTNGGESLTMTGLAGATTYNFRVYRYTSNATAPAPFTFNVSAATGSALPLELKSFTGKVQGSVNVLNWETLTEKNVQFHIVERSADGGRWSEVNRVNSKGDSQVSTSYSLTDNAPLARAYYRLRSVDFDGKESVSTAIVLTRKSDNFGITSVYPSPTTSNVTVQFNSTSEEKVTVRVMDMTGRLVMQQVTEAVKDINELPITLTGLQAGVYSVTVSNSTTVSTPVRFVKQ